MYLSITQESLITALTPIHSTDGTFVPRGEVNEVALAFADFKAGSRPFVGLKVLYQIRGLSLSAAERMPKTLMSMLIVMRRLGRGQRPEGRKGSNSMDTS